MSVTEKRPWQQGGQCIYLRSVLRLHEAPPHPARLSVPPRKIVGMIRSAEIVNTEIRELWADGSLDPRDRDRYHRLVMEWAELKRTEQEPAKLAA